MEDFREVESDPDCASRITVRKDPRHGLIDRPPRGRNDENEYPAPPLFAPQSSPQIKKTAVAGKLPIPLKSNAFIQNMKATCKVSPTISAAPQGHQSRGAADATQLIVRNGELQMRNNELDGIVRRYETDVSQLRIEVNRLKQILRERESSLSDKQAEIDRANMRAAVAETASTTASERAMKTGEAVAALTTEVHHAQCDIASLKSQVEAAQTAEAAARDEASNSRAEAESTRREAANSEALVARLSKELAGARHENTQSQEGLERIQRKLASLRALVKAPYLVTGRGKKRNHAVSSRFSSSEEVVSEAATGQQASNSEYGSVDDRRVEIVVGLCELFSTVTMNDIEYHELQRVLLVTTPKDGHDKGTQVDKLDAAETEDEWARPPGEVTPPKQPRSLVSDGAARNNNALCHSSPLPEETTQGRRISSRREALNARVARKEAEARRIEEERERERAQRIRDARLAREVQREIKCPGDPGSNGTLVEGESQRCSQVESKKRPRTQHQQQLRRAKPDDKHPTLVDPPKSRPPRSREENQTQGGSGHVSTGPSSVQVSPVGSVVARDRGLTSGHEIVDFLPASSEGVLASDNGDEGNARGSTREETDTSASGNSETVDSSDSTELPALAPLAEFVIGDKSLTDDFVGDSVTRRSRSKGEGGPRSARRRSLRLQKILARREGDADDPPAAASETQPARPAGRPRPREKQTASSEPDAEDSNSLVTVPASDGIADGGAKQGHEGADRAQPHPQPQPQPRRCRAEKIAPLGEEEVGGVSVKEVEDAAREWFAEAATPESVLIGVCAMARVLASRYLVNIEIGVETSWDADGAMRCLRTLLVETIRAEAGAIRHGSKAACETASLPPATSKCGTTTMTPAMTPAQGRRKKKLRFRTFDLSSVDMPSDSKDAAKQPSEVPSDMPAREVVRYLERAVAQSDLLRGCLQGLGPEEGVFKRVEALLRGLRTVMISEHASSLIDKTRAACASMGSLVSAKDITGAAALLLDELQPLGEASEGPVRTPLRSLLADFLSSLIRSKLRRLLNPPPIPLTKLACLERAAPEPTNHGTVHKLVQLVPDTRGGVSKDIAAKDGATSAVLTTAMLKLYGYSTCGADEAVAAAESFASDHRSYWDARSLTAASDDVTIEALLLRARQHQGDAIEVLAATRAREFVVSLLNYPGVEEAIALGGGWDDIQNLASSLNTVSHTPNARAHLTLFSDMGKLREWLGCQRSWVNEERATAVLNRLDSFITKCVDKQCTGKHPTDARRTREEARYLRQVAMWEMSFPTVGASQQAQIG